MGPTWRQLGPFCGQLCASLGELEATLGQLGTSLGRLGTNFGQLSASLGQLGPTWGHLRSDFALLVLNFAHLAFGDPAYEHLLEEVPSAYGVFLLFVECLSYLFNVSTACGMLLPDCLFNSLLLVFHLSNFPDRRHRP